MNPEDIENREFLVSMRGYARDQVDTFKVQAAEAVRALQQKLNDALAELAASQSQLVTAKSQLKSLTDQLSEAQTVAVTETPGLPERDTRQPLELSDPRTDAFRQVAQETERILMAAEEVAEDLHEKAMREAAGIVTDARLRAEKIFAEVENAKRSAEQDLERIRESRSMIASQMEDIGRRLAETVARLRVPVESPGERPAGRGRLQAEPRPPVERQAGDRQLVERQAAERQIVERQAAERYGLERQAEERQLAERQALQRQAAERQAAEHLAAERLAAERATEVEAAQRQADSAAGKEKPAEREAAPDRGPAVPVDVEPPEPPPAEAEEAEAPQEPAPTQLAERAGAAVEGGRKPEGPTESSSLSELLEEIRRSREKRSADRREAAAPGSATRAARPEPKPAPRAAPATPRREPKPEPRAAPAAAVPETKPVPAARSARAEPEPVPKPAARAARAEPEPVPKPAARAARAEPEPVPKPAARAARAEPEPEGQPEPAAPDPILERRAQALGDLPLQAARRLKRLFQEDHNDLLDRLRTRRGKGTLDDNLAPLPEQFARFQSGLSEALSKAFAEGRKAAGGGGSADAGKAVSNLVARQVVNPLRAEVSKAVQGGLEAHDTPTAIAERASDVFRVWKGVRTELLGVGMVYAAFNQGLVDGWSRNALTQKVWVLSEEDECPNDVCAKNVASGPVALKSTFPSGHLTPPAHGGCTCTLKSV